MAKRSVNSMARALSKTDRPVGDAGGRSPTGPQIGDALQNIVAGLGTSRDKSSYTRWTLPFTLTRMDLESMYRSSWLAKKIINAPTEDMTREWIEVSWDGKDKDEKSSELFDDAMERFGVREKTTDGLRWGALYGGCCVLPIFDPNEDMSLPLDLDSIKQDSLTQFVVLDRWRLSANGIVDFTWGSDNFGMPTTYQIAEASSEVPIVHWSRVIRFEGSELPYFLFRNNGSWHDSELQAPLDAIRDYDATKKAIASLVWESNVDIVSVEGLVKQLAQDSKAVHARYKDGQLLKSINHTLLLDKGTEEYEQKTITFAGLKDMLVEFQTDVCGAADIPATRLFGQSPAGLNATGESDIRNYYDHIAARQESKLRKPLMRMLDILVRSTLGKKPEHFALTFKPLWQVSDVDRSTIDKTDADRDTANLNNGSVTSGVLARELKNRGTYPSMTDEDVKEAELAGQRPSDDEMAAAVAKKLGLKAPAIGAGATGSGAPTKNAKIEATPDGKPAAEQL